MIRKKRNVSAAQLLNHFMFMVVSATMLFPFLLVISISLSDESSLRDQGYKWIPDNFITLAYQVMFEVPETLSRAYGITIAVTLIGTVLGLLFTSMTAYTISRRDFRYQRILTFYIFFTMLFQGGLVPFYILVTQYLHLKNTIWALILPMLINPFFVMIMKGFLAKIPREIIESVKIDGASEWRIFFQIILPLAKPALATIGLMLSFGYWNDWFNGLLFIEEQRLVPLQLLLFRNMNTIEFINSSPMLMQMNIDMSQLPSVSARMAMVVLAAGPMMLIFPFFQRFFVTGLTVGALKE